jgi:CRISPR-associated endoribonuclease Cas6
VRVRIIFRLKNRGAVLPFHHQHILAQFIKGVIVNGKNENFIDFPYYSFSGLKGQTKVSRTGLNYFSNLVTLVLSSPSKEFIDYVLAEIFKFTSFELGNLQLEPESTEIEKEPEFTSEMKFICISPIVPVLSSFNGPEGKRFIEPEDDEFSDFLFESTMLRMEDSGLYNIGEIEGFNKFQVVPDLEYLNKLRDKEKKFARIYSLFESDVKYEVRGYTLPFKLYAAKEVQEFIFNCGIGNYTYKGFGLVDLANVNPVDRSMTYSFSKAEKVH